MNKIRLKNMLAIVLAAATFSSLAACSKNDEDYGINMDIDLNNKIDLNILMPNSGYTVEEMNADGNAAVVEEVTGYHVNYSQLPSTNASSSLNTQMVAREQYNAIKLTSAQFSDLVAQDVLLPLDDALDKFGADLKSAISEESWDVVRVNGKIYGIPERASSDNIEYPMVFRQDILNELNLSVPATKDELYNVLKTIKTQTNMIPLTFDMYTPLVYSVSAAFGIYSNWQEYEVDGKKEIRYYMDAPQYGEYVDFMTKLYSEGLIDSSVSTNASADCVLKFSSGKAAAISTSLWSVSAIVSGLESNKIISSTQAAATQENTLAYLRALENKNGEEKVYRKSGYTYITAIPFYMAENAGYAIDWMNSKVIDTAEKHNFRDIVIGKENYHWTYNPSTGYAPLSDHFSEKDTASYYLTGTNESVYTQYWLARVKKQKELYRAWSEMMQDADEVGVYNVVDFAPPIADYTSTRGNIELYAQDQFYVMMVTDKGTGNLASYLKKFKDDGGSKATKAINEWYYNK